MIIKILVVGAVIFFVYVAFFKKRVENSNNKTTKKDDESDIMLECPKCKTYIAKDDAILSNGRYFCSKECLG